MITHLIAGLKPLVTSALLVTVCTAAANAQPSPRMSSGYRRLPISIAECKTRADAAFIAQGFRPTGAGADYAFGQKDSYVAEFMCLQAVDGNTWGTLVLASSGNDQAATTQEHARLIAAYENPNQGNAGAGGGRNERRQICNWDVTKAVYDKWQQLGGQNGFLGCAVSPEKDPMRSPAGSSGEVVLFDAGGGGAGGIYHFTSGRYAGQAYEVHGRIAAKWESLGGAEGWLGFPISDEINAPQGRRGNFEGGYILLNTSTGVATAYRNP